MNAEMGSYVQHRVIRGGEERVLQVTHILFEVSFPLNSRDQLRSRVNSHYRQFATNYGQALTFGAFIEHVVVHVVVPSAQADTDAVLDVREGVVVDIGVERLQNGQTGVLHVINNIVFAGTAVIFGKSAQRRNTTENVSSRVNQHPQFKNYT